MNQPMSKTVLITGASSGIGKAAAQLFAQQSWNLVAKARSPEQVPGLA
ncbi:MULTISPECIES: SDR family NAD(P)-dependent oxidoreductase [Cyanophyceae]|nr:SDR family NAD(P)-dependent oxidoreductase [Trichocoleus sp. FACHB-69]